VCRRRKRERAGCIRHTGTLARTHTHTTHTHTTHTHTETDNTHTHQQTHTRKKRRYALDALLAAPHQATRLGLPTCDAFVCPIDPDVQLPMIFVSDLMRGLISLQVCVCLWVSVFVCLCVCACVCMRPCLCLRAGMCWVHVCMGVCVKSE
jgi:hypothetical protein